MILHIDERYLTPKIPRVHFDWKMWEKKNLNIHRGIIETHLNASISIEDFGKRIREGALKEFGSNWIRGLGFGVIVHGSWKPEDIEKISSLIDKRNKSGGAWQWVIFCNDPDKKSIGFHTWAPGYLTPIYQNIQQQLIEKKVQCIFRDVEMDEQMKQLLKTQEYLSVSHWALKALKYIFRKFI